MNLRSTGIINNVYNKRIEVEIDTEYIDIKEQDRERWEIQ